MAIHKPWDRSLVTIGGATMKTGYSLNLAEGQFGVFNTSKQTQKGSLAVDSFFGFAKDSLFELKLGSKALLSRSTSNKSFSSFPFKLSDVVELTVSAPKRTEIGVDEVVIGYNGFDDKTSIKMAYGQEKEMIVELSGKAFEYLGADQGVLTIHVPISAPNLPFERCIIGDACAPVDMLPIINEVVEYLRNFEVKGVKLTNYVDITPVIKLTGLNKTGTIPYNFFCLDICDTGDKGALAIVQAQYPDVQVIRTKRAGAISSYKVTLKAPLPAPAPFKNSIKSIIKGCKDCPVNYTAIPGGILYAVSVDNDNGPSISGALGALGPKVVVSTIVKEEGSGDGDGFYSFIATSKLTQAEITALKNAIPNAPNIAIKEVGSVEALCNATAPPVTTPWSPCGSCSASEQDYVISLPDTECGTTRLPELQAFYPNLVIAETPLKGGCQRQYATKVATNITCNECDEVFKDIFTSVAPGKFEGASWNINTTAINGTGGLYGIRFKGKIFKLSSGECLRDQIGYVEDSVKIRLSGGYITDTNIGTTGGFIKDEPFAVTYLSKFKPRTHVGGNLLSDEVRSRAYHTGMIVNYDFMGRILTGNESNIIDLDAQYVDYAITLRRSIYSQGLSSRNEETITYHILAEVGRHKDVEDVLNALATSAGVNAAHAFTTK